jgi:PhzF family phenazine biosynthesis protein
LTHRPAPGTRVGMTSTKLSVIDAFTHRPFAGNPAAVCVLAEMPDDQWMHLVAREMALSETAFVVPLDEQTWALRWFTPLVEVDLCGHATLAAAFVLWDQGHLPRDRPAAFSTRSGLLTCRWVGEEIEMDFPASKVTEAPEVIPPLTAALGCPLESGFRTPFDLMAVISSPTLLRAVTPDQTALARLSSQLGIRGIIITSPSDQPAYHFLSRFFAPACGVAEDPSPVQLTAPWVLIGGNS